MPLRFANYRLLNKPRLVDLLSIKEDNLQDINISGESSIGNIKDFLPLKDKDKVMLDSWPTIKKEAVIQKEDQSA